MRHSVVGMMTMAFAPAAVMLAGCGNRQNEGKVFVTFLQTRILDKPGLHVPQLTDDEKAAFGPYAGDYAIITDFNHTMDQSISPKLSSAMAAGSIQSVEDVVTKRPQLSAAKTTLDSLSAALGGNIARADGARARLDQPPEVKVTFDKAYDRLVTQPAKVFGSVVPVANKVLGEAIDLGNYIDRNRASVKLSGSTIEATDPAVRNEINQRLQILQASQQEVQVAQARLQRVVYGASS